MYIGSPNAIKIPPLTSSLRIHTLYIPVRQKQHPHYLTLLLDIVESSRNHSYLPVVLLCAVISNDNVFVLKTELVYNSSSS